MNYADYLVSIGLTAQQVLEVQQANYHFLLASGAYVNNPSDLEAILDFARKDGVTP